MSHKVNRFDRLLFSSKAVETALMTALNPMTLSASHYRKRFKAQNYRVAIGILKRVFIAILPFELSVWTFFMFNKRRLNRRVTSFKVLILISFLYKSIEVFFQVWVMVQALCSQHTFDSMVLIVLSLNAYEVGLFLLLSAYLMLDSPLVNKKFIKNDLIS